MLEKERLYIDDKITQYAKSLRMPACNQFLEGSGTDPILLLVLLVLVLFKKIQRLCHFKSDWDEMGQGCLF